MAATDSLSKLKLVEKGIPKEILAFFSIPLIPLKLALPILFAKWTVGSSPMKLFSATIPFSLLFGIIWPIFMFWAGDAKSEAGEYPYWFYVLLFGVFALELVPGYARFVAGMAFAAKVSDPSVGGTYMTLINTLTNIGGTWPSFIALWAVEYVGIPLKDCPLNDTTVYNGSLELIDKSSTVMESSTLATMIETCISKIDGYYVESGICVVLGFLWLIWGRRTILNLQRRPLLSWRLIS